MPTQVRTPTASPTQPPTSTTTTHAAPAETTARVTGEVGSILERRDEGADGPS